MNVMDYQIQFQAVEDGYEVYCPALSGLRTRASTIQEAFEEMKRMLWEWLDDHDSMESTRDLVPWWRI